ncbi:NAD(P)-dependent oxidoreductase [bacterium]|nr:NAD(P)-dependent oxidoreductase [bacterium]
MRKVLIIGSKGMLGQELVRVFSRDKNYKVVGWDRNEIDITDKKKTEKKILKLGPDIIINAAAYNAVDKCEEDEKEYELARKINGLAPGYLAEIAKDTPLNFPSKRGGGKRGAIFIHYSTDYVFGGEMPEVPMQKSCNHICHECAMRNKFTAEVGFDEKAKPSPISRYGKSKLLGEKEVQKHGDKYYIIRLSKLFGKPAISKDAKKSFFDVMLELGRKNKEVKAVDEETSCFTYTPDLAQGTKKIIESKKPFGIYHIANGDPCTWYEAVVELYKQAKLKTKVIPVNADEFPRPAQRPFYSVLLNTKLKPLRSYKEALKEYLSNL